MFCFQLILPECMKLLPLYTNCILKNDILLGGKRYEFHVVWKFIVSKLSFGKLHNHVSSWTI